MSAKVKRAKRPLKVETGEPAISKWWLVAAAAVILFLAFLLLRAVQQESIVFIPDYCRENPDRCLAIGREDAPVTLIEVADYGCRACVQFYLETAPFLNEGYVEEGYLRWLFVPYTNPARPESGAAAEAAFCAAEQDNNFFDFHRLTLALQESAFGFTDIGFLNNARQAGLEIGPFTQCLDSDRYVPLVAANTEAVLEADLPINPTFFVNDFKIEGAASFPTFQQRIDRLID
jgi:protein-disulfide isomerase